jgi:hypothetical protein
MGHNVQRMKTLHAFAVHIRYVIRYLNCCYCVTVLRPDAGHGLFMLEVSRTHISTLHKR